MKKELDELLKRDDLSEDSINDINYIIKNINDEIKEKIKVPYLKFIEKTSKEPDKDTLTVIEPWLISVLMKEPKNSWSELQLKIKDKEYSITLSNAFNPLPALVQMIYNIKNGITPFKIKIDEEGTDKHIEIDSIKDDVYMLCYAPYSDKSENELDIYFELMIEKWIFEKVFANALIHFFKYNYKKEELECFDREKDFDKKALYILKDLSTFKSRIFVVLNRNIHEQYKYTKEEVQAALNKKNFNTMTQREQGIFVKTFKEFDDEDFYQLQIDFDVTLQTLANIFCSSYFYKDTYFRNKWADYFGLEKIEETSKQRVYKPSERVKRILKRRGIT